MVLNEWKIGWKKSSVENTQQLIIVVVWQKTTRTYQNQQIHAIVYLVEVLISNHSMQQNQVQFDQCSVCILLPDFLSHWRAVPLNSMIRTINNIFKNYKRLFNLAKEISKLKDKTKWQKTRAATNKNYLSLVGGQPQNFCHMPEFITLHAYNTTLHYPR